MEFYHWFTMGMLKETSDSGFDKDVASGLVMVDFWAPWCAPCRMVAPVLEDLQGEMKDILTVVKLNVDENPNIATRYSITSIPTLLLFKNGEMVDRIVGAGPKELYKNMLKKHL